MQQTTVANTVTLSGIGLHSGRQVAIRLLEAPPDTGIVFTRTDLPHAPSVVASAKYVTNTMRATTLENGSAKVFTVEHLLAAFHVMAIDNCIVEINAEEPPVADGSALPFIRLLQQAGAKEQAAEKTVLAVSQAFSVYDTGKFIAILPYNGLRVTFTSVNPHPLLGVQTGDYEIIPELFVKEIAPARTIGFLREVEMLRAQGLAFGGSLENAVVYDDEMLLTPLRFSDELVRHKILDCVGDLFLAGLVKGHVIAMQSGHYLNVKLVQELLKDRSLK